MKIYATALLILRSIEENKKSCPYKSVIIHNGLCWRIEKFPMACNIQESWGNGV